jgi:hypothetical protein
MAVLHSRHAAGAAHRHVDTPLDGTRRRHHRGLPRRDGCGHGFSVLARGAHRSALADDCTLRAADARPIRLVAAPQARAGVQSAPSRPRAHASQARRRPVLDDARAGLASSPRGDAASLSMGIDSNSASAPADGDRDRRRERPARRGPQHRVLGSAKRSRVGLLSIRPARRGDETPFLDAGGSHRPGWRSARRGPAISWNDRGTGLGLRRRRQLRPWPR